MSKSLYSYVSSVFRIRWKFPMQSYLPKGFFLSLAPSKILSLIWERSEPFPLAGSPKPTLRSFLEPKCSLGLSFGREGVIPTLRAVPSGGVLILRAATSRLLPLGEGGLKKGGTEGRGKGGTLCRRRNSILPRNGCSTRRQW